MNKGQRVVDHKEDEIVDPATGVPVLQTWERITQCGTCKGSGVLTYERRRRPRDRRTKYLLFSRRCLRCHGSGEGSDWFVRVRHTLKFDLAMLPQPEAHG